MITLVWSCASLKYPSGGGAQMKIVKLDEKDMLIEQLKQENERLKRQLEEQRKVIAVRVLHVLQYSNRLKQR